MVAVDADEFRAGLTRWASGVTIVTAAWGEKVHGMTVSAFASVSLEPPLVLVCADTASHTHGLIRESGSFAVNVLARDQVELSNRFASKKDEWRRFDGLECATGVTGAPLIPGGVASLDCRVHAAHEAGDHVIYVGRVEQVQVSDREPLVYCHHAYHGLQALAGSRDPG